MELKGKWFGLLRWLGISENSEGVTAEVDNRRRRHPNRRKQIRKTLNIEAKFLSSNEPELGLESRIPADDAHWQTLFTAAPSARHVAYYGSSHAYP